MTNKDLTPKQLLELKRNSQIKAYVHPTRITILRMLATKKRTVSSVAKELNVHPANITHHFKLLERVGLIKLVEKRDIGKNIEKYYRSVARSFVVNADRSGRSSKQALELSILRNHLSTAIGTVKTDDKHKVVAVIRIARITPRDIKVLHSKIMKLIQEFARFDSASGKSYTLNISAYPNETDYVSREKIIIDH
ncbi:MAG: helix-turn-helix transcriptional regulator [candidate division WOR-3 bacterium]|nr:MAG: helix-turn-helix transcriptional regulator [candidate division WOR-3 bacterium]